MPALLKLPVELLTEIANLVPQPIYLRGVCRLLNDVATPIAYRALTLPLFDPEVDPEPGTIARMLGRLLRTMMAQPSIGMHVRHLDISFADASLPCRRKKKKKVTKISKDIRIPAVEAAISHGLSKSVREELADGLLGAALFLLLCHFPYLDSLDLIPEMGGNFFHHIETSRMLPCGLRSLHSAYVHEPAILNDLEHENIFALFCLPSLRKIRCNIYEPLDYEYEASMSDFQMVLSGGTSNIEELDIESNQVDTWVLAAMIRSVQGLRSFRYNEGAGADKPFFGGLLADALCAHVDTLETLDICIIEIDESYERYASIGSLRDYTTLTRLAVSMPMLFGYPDPHSITEQPRPRRIGELLPESLISFDVCIDNDWQHTACEYLTRFIEIELKHVPNLKHLSLRVRSIAFSASDLDTTVLRAACVASGIAFSTADLPY